MCLTIQRDVLLSKMQNLNELMKHHRVWPINPTCNKHMVGPLQVIPVALFRFGSFHTIWHMALLMCQIQWLKTGFLSLFKMALQSFLQDYGNHMKKYLGKETLTLADIAGHPPYLPLRWGQAEWCETQGKKRILSKDIYSVSLAPGKLKMPSCCPMSLGKPRAWGLKLQFIIVINGRGVLTL